jgi:transposase
VKEYSTFVGLDTHKEKIAVAVAAGGRGKAEYLYEIPSTTQAVGKMLRRFKKEETLLCYEAGPTGYGLYRYFAKLGYACEVVAPSLVPHKAGDRVKTNRRDAVNLASLLRAGELSAIWVPDEQLEAVRDLTRAREDAKVAEKQAKLTLGSFLLKHNRKCERTVWSKGFFEWLRTITFPYAHQQVVFEDYIETVKRCTERVQALQQQMEKVYEGWELKWLGDALMALRGVSLITSMTILAEIGDLRRFNTARELMAYLGLVPTEATTGDDVRRGSITKTGNSHVRRLLIESAWSYRLVPKKSSDWWRRAKHAPKSVQDIAWKAMVRLHQRYWRLTNRKLKAQKVVVAVARELAGFIWAVAQAAHDEHGQIKKAA